MKWRVVSVACMTLVLMGSAQGKTKKLEVSPAFQTAHSIYVECVDGDPSKPGVSPANRLAVAEVQELLHEWDRYALVPQRDQADLVIVVRKGHRVGDEDHLGLGMHPRVPEPGPVQPGQSQRTAPTPREPISSAANAGDDIAQPDLLRVYTVNEKGKLKGPIWSRELDGGLDGPSVRLVQELKAAVELTFPREAATRPAP